MTGLMLPAHFRVASYNIRKALGTDRRRNPERILHVLAEIDADIVALQEADRRFSARAAVIGHGLLDRHSDYKVVPLAHHAEAMGWHGNALLVAKRFEVAAAQALHLPCLEPRGAVVADVELDSGQLRIFGMHLDLSGLWRRRQASAILHEARTRSPLPTILMGDLNEWSAGRGCLADFGRHFAFAPCGKSFHARRPIGQLDRIMHSPELRLIDSGVHDSALARQASDHLPVWADFALP